ncbi:hypothetical protein VPHG_00070 [Vibrio phage 11895-B1]|uniref:hypothetical protein n=1 Tax=Vibrio phage 11895-B1 TaxID=754075 RepID=UPI0002C07677|nr:hypothetical protein VPHG_00070 [Vibrio phage 11895-B1]AGH32137.1 hypothetical protein VPHG_00070 [Vibrio phage 11895-B1]
MTKWNKTIDLSLRWNEEWNNTNIHLLGKYVAKQIKRVIKDYEDYDKYGFELEELIDNFEEGICTVERANNINKDNYEFHLNQLAEGKESVHYEIIPLEEFDSLMTELYDIADRNSWWVKTIN